MLAKKIGPKWPLIGAMTVCSISSLLIPVMAEKAGSGGVMACRVVQGLCQGFVFPSTHAALSRWAPLPERSRIGSFVYTGMLEQIQNQNLSLSLKMSVKNFLNFIHDY